MFTFPLKFLRFNYQLLWEQQDHDAYINFPQILPETLRLPIIIKHQYQHLYYTDFTTFHTPFSEQRVLCEHFIKEQPETCDSRPYTSSNIISLPSIDNDNNPEIWQQKRMRTKTQYKNKLTHP